jgi:hypothetical protein
MRWLRARGRCGDAVHARRDGGRPHCARRRRRRSRLHQAPDLAPPSPPQKTGRGAARQAPRAAAPATPAAAGPPAAPRARRGGRRQRRRAALPARRGGRGRRRARRPRGRGQRARRPRPDAAHARRRRARRRGVGAPAARCGRRPLGGRQLRRAHGALLRCLRRRGRLSRRAARRDRGRRPSRPHLPQRALNPLRRRPHAAGLHRAARGRRRRRARGAARAAARRRAAVHAHAVCLVRFHRLRARHVPAAPRGAAQPARVRQDAAACARELGFLAGAGGPRCGGAALAEQAARLEGRAKSGAAASPLTSPPRPEPLHPRRPRRAAWRPAAASTRASCSTT